MARTSAGSGLASSQLDLAHTIEIEPNKKRDTERTEGDRKQDFAEKLQHCKLGGGILFSDDSTVENIDALGDELTHPRHCPQTRRSAFLALRS